MGRLFFLSIFALTSVCSYANEQLQIKTNQQDRAFESIKTIKNNRFANRIETNLKFKLTEYDLENGEGWGSAMSPDVAYDQLNERYIVVYSHNEYINNLPQYTECRVLFVDAKTGNIANQNIAVSDQYEIFEGQVVSPVDECKVAVNTINGGFIVVNSLINNQGKREIKAKRFSAEGLAIDGNDIDISDISISYKDDFNAYNPEVVFNTDTLEYLVVWTNRGLELFDFIVLKEQIHARKVPVSGALISNVTVVTSMGQLSDSSINARRPSLTYHPGTKEYLLAFYADGYDINNQNPDINNADNQFQIHVQRIDQAGYRVGDSITITNISNTFNIPLVKSPKVIYYHDPYGIAEDGYYLTWGQNPDFDQDNFQTAIYGCKLDATGFPVGEPTEILPTTKSYGKTDIAYLPFAKQFTVVQEFGDEAHKIARLNLTNDIPKLFNQNANEIIEGSNNSFIFAEISVAAANLVNYYERNFLVVWAEPTDDEETHNLFGAFLKPVVVE